MFLAIREIKKEKSRFTMIMLVTALIAYLVFFLTGLAYGLASANTTAVRNWDAKGIILSKASNENIYISTIDKDIASKLAKESNSLLNIKPTVVSINKSTEQVDLVMMGIETDNENLLPDLKEGTLIQKSDEIVLSESLKKTVDVELGDRVKTIGNGREFKVVGFSESSDYNTQPVGYVSLEMASETMMIYSTGDNETDANSQATPNMPERVSAILTNKEPSKEKLAENELVYLSLDKFIETIPGYQAQILTFGLMIISLVIISAVIISIFMYILTMQKKGIFAVLKVQGISGNYISRSVIYQTFLIGLSGLVVGILMTLLTFRFLPNKVPVLMSWELTISIGSIFIVCSLLGSFFSARSILKIDPLEAL